MNLQQGKKIILAIIAAMLAALGLLMLSKSIIGTNPYNGQADSIQENGKMKNQYEIMEKQDTYQGQTYQFYRADSELLPPGTSNILNVYWIDEKTGTVYNPSYYSLFIGQCKTLFGESDSVDPNETLIDYVVAAEDANGNINYLNVYFASSGPAIGGIASDEGCQKAAEELAEIIKKTKPSDFTLIQEGYDGLPDPDGLKIEMGVKNGMPYIK